jgi:hypothetical protein
MVQVDVCSFITNAGSVAGRWQPECGYVFQMGHVPENQANYCNVP